MPIYEYRCEKCDSHFEVIQKFSDKPLKFCSKCKGRLAKLISQTSFQLKGSGWYVTDYAGNGRKAAEKAESDSADAKETTSDDKKSDKSEKSEKSDKKSKESSPAKKTSEKASTSKSPSGD